jgi:subtilisin-like proprotein convertase family protein
MIQPGVHVLYYDQTHIFADSGQQWTLTVGVADTSKPLKITLAWTDAPGAVGANPALVNNLDLTVSQRRQHLPRQRLQRRLERHRRRLRRTATTWRTSTSRTRPARHHHRRRDQHRRRRRAGQRRPHRPELRPDLPELRALSRTYPDRHPGQPGHVRAGRCGLHRQRGQHPGLQRPGDPERQRQPGRHHGQLLHEPGDPISIPSSGAATPYPSNITVAGFGSTISDVNVHLYDMNHTWPDDIDILLVGPQGQNLIIMSDAGGSNDLINVDLVLDDAAANSLPDSTQIVSGSYKPTNYGTGDTFPAPAPAPSAETLLAIFNGTNPNGAWSLYVVDDAGGDLGNINGGWCLEITGESAGDAAITLTQTVGLDPDTYPLTDEITVPAGTEVTFFYRVENTGTVALPLHTLATSSFGTLLGPDHNYDLLPGESLTLTNSVVVTEPVSNTAIWLATTGGLDMAAASAAATVNVANLGISLSKTVGTEAGVCAASDAIEVAAGTQVYYCYTVENTGDEALALHDLVDDELGAIFLGLAYDLLPGASIDTVTAGLEISAIIDETVTNTAVWTAYNDETFSTAASAAATVTVVEPPLYRILLPLILK